MKMPLRFGQLLVGLALASLPLAAHGYANTTPIDAGYNSRIIDDNLFLNSNSMSAQSIQAFLNAKVPTCDSYHVDTNGNRPSTPWICLKDYVDPTTGKSSAQLIYDEAQSRGINPQVILTTLQKEQSLITDTWPFPSQYKSAMGYGCPESQSVCDAQYYGFFNQVHLGATLLRVGEARDCGDTSTFSNWYVDPKWQLGKSISVDGRVTYLGTCATGSLYNYTPHRPDSAYTLAADGHYYYGNYNFINFFTNYFGPTSSSNLPVGVSLVSATSSGRVYLVDGSNYYYVPSWDILVAYGVSGTGITPVGDSFFTGLTNPGNGTLGPLFFDGSGVFMANSGHKYHVPSAGSCTAWGLDCFNSQTVPSLSAALTGWIASAGDLQALMSNSGLVYKLQAGKKLPFGSVADANNAGYDSSQITPVQNVNATQPLGNLIITRPTAINFAPSSVVYFFDGTAYHHIPNYPVLAAWGFAGIYSPPVSAYNTTPPALAADLGIWQTDGSRDYLIDGGRKIDYTTLKAQWPANTEQAFAGAMLPYLPTVSVGTSGVTVNGGIYLITGGVKRHITTYEDLLRIGVDLSAVVSLTPDGGAALPDGPPILPEPTVYNVTGSSKIDVTNGNVSLHIPDGTTFNAYNFSWTHIRPADTALVAGYPESEDLSTLVKDWAGQAFYVDAGHRYAIMASDTTNWGLNPSSFTQVVGGGLLSGVSPASLTRLICNRDDGRIYYGSGGSRHYVTSYATYLSLGGYANTTTVSSALVNLIPAGSNL